MSLVCRADDHQKLKEITVRRQKQETKKARESRNDEWSIEKTKLLKTRFCERKRMKGDGKGTLTE